jgi:hypothetical protein
LQCDTDPDGATKGLGYAQCALEVVDKSGIFASESLLEIVKSAIFAKMTGRDGRTYKVHEDHWKCYKKHLPMVNRNHYRRDADIIDLTSPSPDQRPSAPVQRPVLRQTAPVNSGYAI